MFAATSTGIAVPPSAALSRPAIYLHGAAVDIGAIATGLVSSEALAATVGTL